MSQALERIDRAAARIEAAAARAPADAGASEELNRLKQAHEALRGKVSGAIQQIDRLLQLDKAR